MNLITQISFTVTAHIAHTHSASNKKIHSLSFSHQQNNFHKFFIAYFINIIHKVIHVEFINGNYNIYRCAPFSKTVPAMATAAAVPSTTENM